VATGKNSNIGLKACPACRGKGRPHDCQTCWGTSSEPLDGRNVPCHRCKGSGRVSRI